MTPCRWKSALFAAVASAGIACGQTPESTAIIQQSGGLPESCRVLRTWTTERGQKAWLLESLDSEEKLTVVQSGNDRPGKREVRALIYRWANSVTPPEGTPVPPPMEAASAPAPRLLPVAASVPASSPPPPVVAECKSEKCVKEKDRCGYIHHYEKPASLSFKAGECVPLCAPDSSTNFGYYPTQWRPCPDSGPPMPSMKRD